MINLSPFKYRPGTFVSTDNGCTNKRTIEQALKTKKITYDDLLLLQLLSRYKYINIHNLERLITFLPDEKYYVIKKFDLKRKFKRYHQYGLVIHFEFVPSLLNLNSSYIRVPRIYKLAEGTYRYFLKYNNEFNSFLLPLSLYNEIQSVNQIFQELAHMQLSISTFIQINTHLSIPKKFSSNSFLNFGSLMINDNNFKVLPIRRTVSYLLWLEENLKCLQLKDNTFVLLLCEDELHIEEIELFLSASTNILPVYYITDLKCVNYELRTQITMCEVQDDKNIVRSCLSL